MVNCLLGLLIFLSLTIGWVCPVQADTCRQWAGQQVCILDIKRSAKRYWEYWAKVSVNGVKRPLEVYDCLNRLYTRQDGRTLSFRQDPAGVLVCRLFKPNR